MSTYTSSLGLEEITPGDQAGLWGNTTNNNLALIDQAVTGVTPISFTGLSGTVYTLTDFDGAVDEARSAVLNITGIATGSNTVVVPNKQKTYLVRNNTGQNVIFRTASPTATYTVEAGNSILIFCDGNNNVFTGIASPSVGTLGVAGGGTGATTFTAGFVKSTGGTNALTSSSAVNLASEVTGTLPVPSGGTGQTSFASGALLRGNGSGAVATLVGSANGQVATWNGSEWTAQTPAAASGVTSVSGSGNISVSPTTGNPVVSITSSPTFTTVNFGSSSNNITSSGGALNFIASGVQTVSITNQGIGANAILTNTGLFTSGTNTASLGFGATPYVSVNTSNIFFPNFDNALSLGSGGNRWTTVFATNPTINTSDFNQKTEIADLDEAEKRVAIRIKGLIKKFKWKDAVAQKGSDGARIHVGVIAQEIGEAFRAEGLNPDRYGMFCYDEWPAQEEIIKHGVVIQPAKEAGSSYGVRYEELLAFVIAVL